MDDAGLDRIEALAEAATKGPWKVAERRDGSVCGIDQEDGYDDVVAPGRVECMAYCYGGTSVVEATDADWAFIAASRSAVPALVAEVRRLHAEIERIVNPSGEWEWSEKEDKQ